MVIGIRPTVDFAFKRIFGNTDHTAVTIHFLNAILSRGPRITQIEILNPSLGKNSEVDKLAILDVLATDEHRQNLEIEMQTTLPQGMSQRLTYYSSRLYADQMREGTSYSALRPAISICVLTKSLFSTIPKLHLDFRLREESGALLTDDLQIHLLELSKLRVTAENVSQASPIEQWACFLQHVQELTPLEVQQLFPDREFSEAAGVLEMISRSPTEQRLYDARLKIQRDEEARLAGALREGEEKGEKRGEEKGAERGRREGVLIGRVALLSELLGLPVPTTGELSLRGEVELTKMEEELQSQLRHRGQ